MAIEDCRSESSPSNSRVETNYSGSSDLALKLHPNYTGHIKTGNAAQGYLLGRPQCAEKVSANKYLVTYTGYLTNDRRHSSRA